MKKIDYQIEQLIVEDHKNGTTGKDNAIKHKVSERTIRRIIKKNNAVNFGNLPGRPKILNSREDRLLVRKYGNCEIKTSSQGVSLIRDITNKEVSKSTIKRRLYSDGYKSYKEKKAHLLSKKNLKARKKYFQTHKGKTYDEFENFIFSDESSFRILNVKGCGSYYKKANIGSKIKSVIRTKKFGGGGIMIWGFITSKGDFRICKCPSKMNSNSYLRIMEEYALPEIIKCGLKLSDIIFMQDNATCHKSKASQNWFKANNIRLLDWPPQSPDLNPIENVWDLLDRRARVRQNEIITNDDLWKVLQEVLKVDKKYIIKLYQSIPRRINAMKDSKYDITKY